MPAGSLTPGTTGIGVRQLVAAARRQALARSIRFKIMGMVLGLVLGLGLTVPWQVPQGLAANLGEQLDERGVALAHELAARSTDFILTNNTFALYELVRDTVESNKDVRYVFLLDHKGQVLVHSFGAGFPTDLLRVNRLSYDSAVQPPSQSVSYQIQVLDSTEGLIHDVAVPIFEGRAGVARVGMSEHRLRAAIENGTRNVLLATMAVLLAGIVISFGLTHFMTRPILDLVEVARAVGRGDLERKAQRWMDDEIGQLSSAFNRMIEELRHKEAMRSHLLEKVITAQEDERKRIARELHDEAGPSLTSLMVGLRMIEDAAGNEAEVRRRTGELKALAGQVLDDLHRLAIELRPSSLDHLGLVATLSQYVCTYARQHGLTAEFQAIGFDGRRLSPGLEIALYRIVQEALTNAARHAQATQVGVVVEHRGTSVVAIVEDNGRGFDVAQVLQGEHERLGLYGMQERATLIGGRLTLESAPGQGTTVFAEIPVREGERAYG